MKKVFIITECNEKGNLTGYLEVHSTLQNGLNRIKKYLGKKSMCEWRGEVHQAWELGNGKFVYLGIYNIDEK